MWRVALILVALLLASTVVPAFAGPGDQAPIDCPLESPFGEPLRGAPSQGEGGSDNVGGTPADPPPEGAGDGSHTGDAARGDHVCRVLGEEEGPPREDPNP